MAAILFADVLKTGTRGTHRYGTTETKDWFRTKAMYVVNAKAESLIEKAGAFGKTKPLIGEMVLFNYDAKHKATLPYFDQFPLIFPISMLDDGFIGINLHYLPPLYRARLMDALYSLMNNKKYNDTSKLVMSYQILKSAAKFKYFRPCIKRYLFSHVRSKIVPIDVKEWDYCMMLPLGKFSGANQSRVYEDSMNLIRMLR